MLGQIKNQEFDELDFGSQWKTVFKLLMNELVSQNKNDTYDNEILQKVIDAMWAYMLNDKSKYHMYFDITNVNTKKVFNTFIEGYYTEYRRQLINCCTYACTPEQVEELKLVGTRLNVNDGMVEVEWKKLLNKVADAVKVLALYNEKISDSFALYLMKLINRELEVKIKEYNTYDLEDIKQDMKNLELLTSEFGALITWHYNLNEKELINELNNQDIESEYF